MCTFPLFVSFYPPDSTTGQNLTSLLSTVYCFGQLVFLGFAQAQVGKVSSSKRREQDERPRGEAKRGEQRNEEAR